MKKIFVNLVLLLISTKKLNILLNDFDRPKKLLTLFLSGVACAWIIVSLHKNQSWLNVFLFSFISRQIISLIFHIFCFLSAFLSTDGKCTGWIIGFAILVFFCIKRYIIILAVILCGKTQYCYRYVRNIRFNQRSSTAESTSNGDINYNSESCNNGNGDSNDDNGENNQPCLPYGVPEGVVPENNASAL